jgi:hypothetical protein
MLYTVLMNTQGAECAVMFGSNVMHQARHNHAVFEASFLISSYPPPPPKLDAGTWLYNLYLGRRNRCPGNRILTQRVNNNPYLGRRNRRPGNRILTQRVNNNPYLGRRNRCPGNRILTQRVNNNHYLGRRNRCPGNRILTQRVNNNCSFTGEYYSRISIIIQIIQAESPPHERRRPTRTRWGGVP